MCCIPSFGREESNVVISSFPGVISTVCGIKNCYYCAILTNMEQTMSDLRMSLIKLLHEMLRFGFLHAAKKPLSVLGTGNASNSIVEKRPASPTPTAGDLGAINALDLIPRVDRILEVKAMILELLTLQLNVRCGSIQFTQIPASQGQHHLQLIKASFDVLSLCTDYMQDSYISITLDNYDQAFNLHNAQLTKDMVVSLQLLRKSSAVSRWQLAGSVAGKSKGPLRGSKAGDHGVPNDNISRSNQVEYSESSSQELANVIGGKDGVAFVGTKITTETFSFGIQSLLDNHRASIYPEDGPVQALLMQTLLLEQDPLIRHYCLSHLQRTMSQLHVLADDICKVDALVLPPVVFSYYQLNTALTEIRRHSKWLRNMSQSDKRNAAFVSIQKLLHRCKHFCMKWGSILISDYKHRISGADCQKFRKVIVDMDGIELMFTILRLPLNRDSDSDWGTLCQVAPQDIDLRNLFVTVYKFLTMYAQDASVDHKANVYAHLDHIMSHTMVEGLSEAACGCIAAVYEGNIALIDRLTTARVEMFLQLARRHGNSTGWLRVLCVFLTLNNKPIVSNQKVVLAALISPAGLHEIMSVAGIGNSTAALVLPRPHEVVSSGLERGGSVNASSGIQFLQNLMNIKNTEDCVKALNHHAYSVFLFALCSQGDSPDAETNVRTYFDIDAISGCLALVDESVLTSVDTSESKSTAKVWILLLLTAFIFC